MNKSRVIVIILLVLLSILIFYFDLHMYFDFNYLKSKQLSLEKLNHTSPILFVLGYFFIYVLTTALSIPVATVLTLVGSAVMGFWKALIVISFASTVGASISFLLARYLFRATIKKKFSKQMERVNAEFAKNGGYYLASMRLVPVMPFLIINIVMSLTSIKLVKFYLISQITMLLGTIFYVNAGTKIGELESVNDIMSFELIFSFCLLGLVPLLLKKLLDLYNSRGAV